MSMIDRSSPRGTEGAASSSGFKPQQMEVPQGAGDAQSQLGVECPLILDLMMKFQKLSLDDAKSTPGDPSKPEDVVSEESEVLVKDGNYFMNLVKNEQNRLSALAVVAENYSSSLATDGSISEDVFGMLRSAAGSARLLVSSKMNQFEGLCRSNLNPKPTDQFPTTVDDLQGFWDMVLLQVTQLEAVFVDIERLKANNWQLTAGCSSPRAAPKKLKAKPSKSSTAPPATEEQKKRILERRMALVKARQAAGNRT